MNRITTKKYLKTIWRFLPEICITGLLFACLMDGIYAFFSKGWDTSMWIGYGIVAVVLACSIGQFYWKSLAVSFFFSAVFGLGSLYMLLAVLSEYSEFPAGDPKGMELLLVGTLLFGGLALLSFIMPWKYLMTQALEPARE